MELQEDARRLDRSAHFRLTALNPEATRQPVPVLVSGVYNYPRPTLQDHVWNDLLHVSPCTNCPWLVVGDFNSILHPSERVGGRIANWSRIDKFRSVLANAHLEDLRFYGSAFTWSNRSFGRHFICDG